MHSASLPRLHVFGEFATDIGQRFASSNNSRLGTTSRGGDTLFRQPPRCNRAPFPDRYEATAGSDSPSLCQRSRGPSSPLRCI